MPSPFAMSRIRRTLHLGALVATTAAVAPAQPSSARAPRVPAPSEIVPITYDDARVWVSVRVQGAPPRWFILDTGAQPTVLDRELARTLGIGTADAGERTGAGAGRLREGTATVSDLSVGDTHFRALDVMVAPLDSLLGPFTGHVVGGIVGSRYFMDRVLTLDFARGEMRVSEPAAYRVPAGAVVVPIEITGGVPYARGMLTLPNGSRLPMRLLVDLGAKATLLVSEPFAERHGLARALGPGVVATLGAGIGGETRYRFVRVPRLDVGDAGSREGVAHAEQLVAGLSVEGTLRSGWYDGLLGAEFLRRYGVTIDYPGRRLVLVPLHGASVAELDMAGLYVTASGPERRPTVYRVIPGGPAADAGVHEGDVLLAVEGASVTGTELGALRDLLRSAPGRVVALRLRRGDAPLDAPVDVRLRLRRLV